MHLIPEILIPDFTRQGKATRKCLIGWDPAFSGKKEHIQVQSPFPVYSYFVFIQILFNFFHRNFFKKNSEWNFELVFD